MLDPVLTKNFTASAAVRGNRICKYTAEGQVAECTADTDASIGISTALAAEIAERVDVVLIGVQTVIYGGNVTRGAPLTSDAQGRAIVAAAGDRVIGYAMVAGALNDEGSCLIDRTPVLA
jgi:hypothetical protein